MNRKEVMCDVSTVTQTGQYGDAASACASDKGRRGIQCCWRCIARSPERRESDRSAAPRGGCVNAIRRSMGIVVGLMFLWMAGTLGSEDTKSLDARRQELKKLVAEEWEYVMREYPEFATIVGDYRYNDRWSDGSLAHVEQTKKDEQKWLARFEAIDTTGFPEQERLDQQLMVRNLKAQIESIELKLYEMPVDQFYGAHLQLAQFVASIPFHTTRQDEDYPTPLHQIP